MSQYLLVAAILVLALVIIWLACRGQYGRILAAIQDNEQKAQSLGYNTSAHLLFVFMTSGGLAALSGALYASLAGYVAPDLVGLLLTTQAIIHVALGGRGSLIGPVLATVFVIRLQQTVSSYSYALWPLMLGVFFIAIVFVFPDGILGPIRKLFDAFAKGRGVRR